MSVGNEAESIYPLVKKPSKLSILLPSHTTVPGNTDHTLRVTEVRIFSLDF